MDWQPIATAPMDGSVIMTAWGEVASQAGYMDGRWWICYPGDYVSAQPHQRVMDSPWFPTHWQPMPKTLDVPAVEGYA